MKKFFLLLVFSTLLLSSNIFGAYVKDQPYQITQPDGTVIDCFVSGDEFFNWLHDSEGFTIIQAEDGYYYYGIEEKGIVVPSSFKVNQVNPEAVGLKRWAKISRAEYFSRKELLTKEANTSTRAPHLGTMNNLVVYIKFSDDSEFTTTRQTYDNLFNQPTGNSLKSYFNEVSYTQFTIGSTHYPDCALTTNYSYTDTHARNYFEPYNATTNPAGYNGSTERTTREHTLLKDAITWINANSPVPAGLNIDGDNDNKVDNVCFIIRGGNGAWASLLWAHRWALYTENVYINGKRVYDYTFQPETQVNVRTLCHEMFHALGAPDLYHYDDGGLNIAPVSSWDLMESGGGHMGAYMKWKYTNNSWISSIPEITTSGTYTLNPLTSSTNNCYKIISPNSTSQYFVVEYRKTTGTFESNLPGSGLIVYRIDPAYNGNASGPPDEVYIYRPNGTTAVNGTTSSAYFSAGSGRTAINDGTNPSSFLQNGSAGGLNIYNVTAADNTISFTIGISYVTNPISLTANSVSGSQINLNWQKNSANNNVVLAYSTTPTFGIPVTGTGYTAGATIPGGGTVIYAGSGTSFNHTSLSQATTYYYKLWSVDGTNTYSNGLTAYATTDCGITNLPYTQSFNEQIFPACWTQQVSGSNVSANWTISNTSNAGGTANEMMSTYQDKNPATTRLVSLPLNTTGVSSLNLSFRHMLDDYGAGATLKVQSSSDGTNWTDEAWSLATSSNSNVGPYLVNTTIQNNLNSASTYIAFTIEGNLYQYDYWYIDNVSVSAAAVTSYQITTSSNPTAGGSTSGGGNYNQGAQATVTASPANGYNFINWTENGNPVSTSASYTFTVNANRTLVANFTIQQFTVSTSSSPMAGGTTSGGGSYNFGAQATVTASPANGYNFINWTENGNTVSTSASYTFTVNANRTLVANFTIQQFTVSTSSSPTAGGSTSGGGSYNFGAQATVTASPANGYNFVNWTENGNPVSTSASYTFTVNANRTLVANFTIQQFTVSTSSSPMAGGTTSGGGSYNFGAQATVTASPANGYNFVNWTENGNPVSTSDSYTFTVNANRTLVANFTIQQFTVSTSSSPTAGGTTLGGGSYNFGTQATVTASPANGYNFVNWTENGNPVSTSASYTFTVNANRTLVANFTEETIEYTITTLSSPASGGNTAGGGTYVAGTQATVTASPANGYNFVNWTENGNPVSTSASYTFTVNANRTLVANFTEETIEYTITTLSSPASGGNTTGGGTYVAGAQATVTASPANGYNFVNWTENGNPVSTSASYTFTVNANRTLVANFTIQQFTVSTSSSPTAGGTTSGGGSYNFGAQATVTASPANGYNFVNWTENGNPVSTSASYTFTVNANRTLVANFTIQQYFIKLNANPENGGYTNGEGYYNEGETATIEAFENNGYMFVSWEENGNPVSTNPVYSFQVNSSRELVAHFELQVGIITHDQIGIVIYPNPSTGIVYLESASPESVIFEAVEVVNLAGKKVYDAQITNPISKVKARLNSLPDGVYFFKIKPLNHNEFIRKIIIKK